MTQSARYSVILVVLLLLAGCSGFLGSRGGPPEVSVTPADVPSDNPTVAPRGQIAPGVTATGVYNASALAHAHARILGNTSFTIRMNLTHHYPNGTLAQSTTGIRRVETGPPLNVRVHYLLSVEQSVLRHSNRSSVLAVNLWYDSENRYQRTIYTNNTTKYDTHSFRFRRGAPYQLTYAWRINRTLSTADTQVTRLTRNGSTYYRIEGTIPSKYHSTSPSTKQNSSYWMLIDSRGVVHEYHHTVTSSGPNGTTVHIHLDIYFQKIGNTTVTRPTWVETARNRTETANRTTTTRSKTSQIIEASQIIE